MSDEIKRSHTRSILDVNINRFHRHEHLNELKRNISGDCQVKSRTSLLVPIVDDIAGGVGGSGCDEKVHELRVFVKPLERRSLETGDAGVKESVTSVVSGGDQRWRGGDQSLNEISVATEGCHVQSSVALAVNGVYY